MRHTVCLGGASSVRVSGCIPRASDEEGQVPANDVESKRIFFPQLVPEKTAQRPGMSEEKRETSVSGDGGQVQET